MDGYLMKILDSLFPFVFGYNLFLLLYNTLGRGGSDESEEEIRCIFGDI